MTNPDRPLCNKFVTWWDGEYEGNCVRPADHEGDHWDGMSWYDDDMVPRDDHHDDRPADVDA